MLSKLEFEYCECGCHGHEAARKGLYYWIYNDLGDPPKFYLNNGHGFLGVRIGVYKSFEEAEAAAQLHYDNHP